MPLAGMTPPRTGTKCKSKPSIAPVWTEKAHEKAAKVAQNQQEEDAKSAQREQQEVHKQQQKAQAKTAHKHKLPGASTEEGARGA